MKRLIFFLLLTVSFYANADCRVDLAAATGAGNSIAFSVDEGRTATILITAAAGHTAAEYSDIQMSQDGGTTWEDLYQNTAQVRLHATNTAVTVYGPGTFRIAKEATTNATAINRCIKGFL